MNIVLSTILGAILGSIITYGSMLNSKLFDIKNLLILLIKALDKIEQEKEDAK